MELNESSLHDLHNGTILNENQYIERMSISATVGGLWGDFTEIKWILDYLQKKISIWNIQNGRIFSTFGREFNNETLHIAFGYNHFEPIEVLDGLRPIDIPT